MERFLIRHVIKCQRQSNDTITVKVCDSQLAIRTFVDSSTINIRHRRTYETVLCILNGSLSKAASDSEADARCVQRNTAVSRNVK